MQNNLRFFKGMETVGEVKAMYRQLAKEFHPDKGGSHEQFIALGAEYEMVLASMDGQTRVGDDGKEYVYKYNAKTEKAVMDKVAEILKVMIAGDLDWEVEIIGVWVWVSNTSLEHKNLLNKNGLKMRWHSKRERWYWKPYSQRTRYSGRSMNDLRAAYGSRVVEKEDANGGSRRQAAGLIGA